ncbi:cell wall hydrolase [Alkaliphilus peptidifermentans]|uniref:N-acetylmuramoyl-L-alanine amidase n=1 Tax=Alkaliphilus peptidifermentans DSM 18978 TaxID=1120976 RepID=A0A1G5F457_9FIRM|nr:cell wall hydrolase [Alkaliphilus peptidifermentans]SCY33987.1 N-acetylmuramoyl-L-alanine amidase [Alkaliphilus peptidifermentans DSM 18978]
MKLNNKKVVSLILIIFLISIQVIGVFAGESYSMLRFGSRGNEVVRLQQALQNLAYYNFTVDGIYGKITERAVINFQIDSRIRIDGIAGPQTQSTLYGKTNPVSTRSNTVTASINTGDVYWLARIIHAEAAGEPYRGKVAVGNVVLNRVNSKDFPNTIYNVIFEYYKNIPQFSPVADGSIYNNPCNECTQAAREAINGSRSVGNSTYFFNPSKAAGTWIVRNKSYVTKIGGHAFYQ